MRFNEAIDQALAESAVKFQGQTNQTRDTFLAMLGHDLRGPLASMANAGDYLSRPEAHGAATMAVMVDDLLEYSRVPLGGKMPLKPVASNLRLVALTSMHDIRAVHPDCQIDLHANGNLAVKIAAR